MRRQKVPIIDKRDHVGGNCYTKEIAGIHVHWYGAHIMHTSDQRVWDYVQQFAEFNRYTNSSIGGFTKMVEKMLASENIEIPEYEVPYTRIVGHKHFELACQSGKSNPKTVITREYPAAWKRGEEPYYPMNDEKNNAIYMKYKELADRQDKVIFGGRLGLYKYFDMHQVIGEALKLADECI